MPQGRSGSPVFFLGFSSRPCVVLPHFLQRRREEEGGIIYVPGKPGVGGSGGRGKREKRTSKRREWKGGGAAATAADEGRGREGERLVQPAQEEEEKEGEEAFAYTLSSTDSAPTADAAKGIGGRPLSLPPSPSYLDSPSLLSTRKRRGHSVPFPRSLSLRCCLLLPSFPFLLRWIAPAPLSPFFLFGRPEVSQGRGVVRTEEGRTAAARVNSL